VPAGWRVMDMAMGLSFPKLVHQFANQHPAAAFSLS